MMCDELPALRFGIGFTVRLKPRRKEFPTTPLRNALSRVCKHRRLFRSEEACDE